MGEELSPFINFTLLEKDYAIDVMKVISIEKMLDITPIPKMPKFIEGVIDLRNEVIPIIDLRKRFDLPPKIYNAETRIILIELEEKHIGFIVDSVKDVIRLSASEVKPPPTYIKGADIRFISGIGKIEDKLIIILDVEKILSEEEKKLLLEL